VRLEPRYNERPHRNALERTAPDEAKAPEPERPLVNWPEPLAGALGGITDDIGFHRDLL